MKSKLILTTGIVSISALGMSSHVFAQGASGENQDQKQVYDLKSNAYYTSNNDNYGDQPLAVVGSNEKIVSAAPSSKVSVVDPFSVKVGGSFSLGYASHLFGLGESGKGIEEEPERSGFFWSGKIAFKGKGIFDNGLILGIGTRLNLKLPHGNVIYTGADAKAKGLKVAVDRYYATLQGAFGKFIFGAAPSPLAQIGSEGVPVPGFDKDFSGNDLDSGMFDPTLSKSSTMKLGYLTPTIPIASASTQFGMSFTPTSADISVSDPAKPGHKKTIKDPRNTLSFVSRMALPYNKMNIYVTAGYSTKGPSYWADTTKVVADSDVANISESAAGVTGAVEFDLSKGSKLAIGGRYTRWQQNKLASDIGGMTATNLLSGGVGYTMGKVTFAAQYVWGQGNNEARKAMKAQTHRPGKFLEFHMPTKNIEHTLDTNVAKPGWYPNYKKTWSGELGSMKGVISKVNTYTTTPGLKSLYVTSNDGGKYTVSLAPGVVSSGTNDKAAILKAIQEARAVMDKGGVPSSLIKDTANLALNEQALVSNEMAAYASASKNIPEEAIKYIENNKDSGGFYTGFDGTKAYTPPASGGSAAKIDLKGNLAFHTFVPMPVVQEAYDNSAPAAKDFVKALGVKSEASANVGNWGVLGYRVNSDGTRSKIAEFAQAPTAIGGSIKYEDRNTAIYNQYKQGVDEFEQRQAELNKLATKLGVPVSGLMVKIGTDGGGTDIYSNTMKNLNTAAEAGKANLVNNAKTSQYGKYVEQYEHKRKLDEARGYTFRQPTYNELKQRVNEIIEASRAYGVSVEGGQAKLRVSMSGSHYRVLPQGVPQLDATVGNLYKEDPSNYEGFTPHLAQARGYGGWLSDSSNPNRVNFNKVLAYMMDPSIGDSLSAADFENSFGANKKELEEMYRKWRNDVVSSYLRAYASPYVVRHGSSSSAPLTRANDYHAAGLGAFGSKFNYAADPAITSTYRLGKYTSTSGKNGYGNDMDATAVEALKKIYGSVESGDIYGKTYTGGAYCMKGAYDCVSGQVGWEPGQVYVGFLRSGQGSTAHGSAITDRTNTQSYGPAHIVYSGKFNKMASDNPIATAPVFGPSMRDQFGNQAPEYTWGKTSMVGAVVHRNSHVDPESDLINKPWITPAYLDHVKKSLDGFYLYRGMARRFGVMPIVKGYSTAGTSAYKDLGGADKSDWHELNEKWKGHSSLTGPTSVSGNPILAAAAKLRAGAVETPVHWFDPGQLDAAYLRSIKDGDKPGAVASMVGSPYVPYTLARLFQSTFETDTNAVGDITEYRRWLATDATDAVFKTVTAKNTYKTAQWSTKDRAAVHNFWKTHEGTPATSTTTMNAITKTSSGDEDFRVMLDKVRGYGSMNALSLASHDDTGVKNLFGRSSADSTLNNAKVATKIAGGGMMYNMEWGLRNTATDVVSSDGTNNLAGVAAPVYYENNKAAAGYNYAKAALGSTTTINGVAHAHTPVKNVNYYGDDRNAPGGNVAQNGADYWQYKRANLQYTDKYLSRLAGFNMMLEMIQHLKPGTAGDQFYNTIKGLVEKKAGGGAADEIPTKDLERYMGGLKHIYGSVGYQKPGSELVGRFASGSAGSAAVTAGVQTTAQKQAAAANAASSTPAEDYVNLRVHVDPGQNAQDATTARKKNAVLSGFEVSAAYELAAGFNVIGGYQYWDNSDGYLDNLGNSKDQKSSYIYLGMKYKF